jgi:hypothetical protein
VPISHSTRWSVRDDVLEAALSPLHVEHNPAANGFREPSIPSPDEPIVGSVLERVRAFADANRHSHDGLRVGEIPYDGLDPDDVACVMDVVAYPRNRDGRTFVRDLVTNLDSK